MTLYDVTVEPHVVVWPATGAQYSVREHQSVARAGGVEDARAEACRRAHRDSRVPNFRSLQRQSFIHSRASTWIDPNPKLRRRR